MESIFESLENLNVSEECFNEIMGIVEELLSEAEDNYEAAQDRRDRNKWKVYDKTACVYYDCKGGKRGAQKEAKRLNTNIPAKPQVDLSYESFNNIPNILEEIIDTIHKKYKYGAPEYYENGGSDLEDKARAASDKEGKEAEEREGRKGKDIREKRVMTKNLKGDLKNFDRKMKQWNKAASAGTPAVNSTPWEPVVLNGGKNKVSESLYNEIAELVEAILSENIYDAIDKKYGEGKNVNLRKKAISNAGKEMSAAWQRDAASSGSSDPDKRTSRALEINRAQKRFGDGKSIHMEQERQLERGKAKPITNEIGKAIIKGNDEFDKAHKEAVSASRLSRKADKKVKGAFDNAGYMTDKYSDPKDADKAWDTAQDLSAKRQAALNKLADVSKKQKENAKYAKYVKYAGSVPNKTGSGVHSGIKHS